MEYDYARRELEGAKLGNSKVLVDGGNIHLLLAMRKNVETAEYKNKLFIDVNEDGVDRLLVDYEKSRAVLFWIKHDSRRIRTNYRRIRKGVQTKAGNPISRRAFSPSTAIVRGNA